MKEIQAVLVRVTVLGNLKTVTISICHSTTATIIIRSFWDQKTLTVTNQIVNVSGVNVTDRACTKLFISY